MLTQAQRDLIEEKVQDIINDAEEKFGVDLGYVDISFALKGRIAGKAIWRNKLEFNRPVGAYDLRLQFNQEAFAKDWNGQFNDTIPHEVAHLVCAVNPRLGNNHNSGWRHIDISLGGTGETYHNLTLTPGRTTKRYKYIASCGTECDLSHVLHNRVQRGQNRTLKATGGKINASCDFREYIKGEA